MSSIIYFILITNLARVYFSISSFRFETKILVAGLMLLNRIYIIVGLSFLMIPPASSYSHSLLLSPSFLSEVLVIEPSIALVIMSEKTLSCKC